MSETGGAELCALVVHWGDRDALAALLAAWPHDARFELVVVDNEGGAPPQGGLPPRARWIAAARNLGFAGGVARALRETTAPIVLVLNPDAQPLDGALPALLDAFARFPDAVGIAPRLLDRDGSAQHRWQLRPLPGALHLLGQALFLPVPKGPRREPAEGTAIEQPAAAALALRRDALERLGGFDRGYYPAWFEDVDLCRRIAAAGERLVYWPAARFRHGLGGSVQRLGYGAFLWIYGRNLRRYARRHHGRAVAAAVRALLPVAAMARLLALPLRRPRRAPSRRAAAGALLVAALGAACGWRLPRDLRLRFEPPPEDGHP